MISRAQLLFCAVQLFRRIQRPSETALDICAVLLCVLPQCHMCAIFLLQKSVLLRRIRLRGTNDRHAVCFDQLCRHCFCKQLCQLAGHMDMQCFFVVNLSVKQQKTLIHCENFRFQPFFGRNLFRCKSSIQRLFPRSEHGLFAA